MSNEITASGELQAFELAQRQAKLFTVSDLVPTSYKGNVANCLIAMNMAKRMNCDPLMAMQSIFIIQGRPAMSAQFLIAAFNKTGRFSTIRYEFTGVELTDSWGCRCSAIERETGDRHSGTLVTIAMAKADGWFGKNKKWQSMTEHMIRFRAATFFIRQIAPEISLGFQTDDEVRDISPAPKTASRSVDDLLNPQPAAIEGEFYAETA